MNLTQERKKRRYLNKEMSADWESIETCLQELLNRPITSIADLLSWLSDKSELEAFLEEDFAWRYIRMSTHTDNEQNLEAFQYFATQIEPKLAPFSDLLNRKLVESPYCAAIDTFPYSISLRKTRNQIELYREESIPIHTELQLEQQKFASISGAMSVEIEGKTLTLEQASNFLKSPDRAVRHQIYEKIAARRLENQVELDTLFDKLLELRQKLALQAGFSNFRDYSFAALNRFDYTPEDTINFHTAIEQEIVPILAELASYRQQKMGLSELKPWDTEVDFSGLEALKPFHGGNDLIEKSIKVFDLLDPFFGKCLSNMKEEHLFDVESRMGKAPGGYNYPLAETGAPFIFMNAADSFRDVTTMVHEGGHAVHTFLSRDLALNDFKHLPSEVAELASMSMELLSMNHWNVFFPNESDLKRAKRDQLIDALKTLPWVATIDAFQHWIYTHPGHTVPERRLAWTSTFKRFGAGFVNWDGYEKYEENLWQKQLHLFEVPFYYIEYAISGLGAMAIWKNFKENPDKTLKQYKEALTLGYTRSIREIYETAGIRFDFSSGYIKELAAFIKAELKELL